MKKLIVTSQGQTEVDLTAEEILEVQAREEAWLLEKPRKEILAQIQALEAQQTPRRLREAALGQDGGWLGNLEMQITNLRQQLNALEN